MSDEKWAREQTQYIQSLAEAEIRTLRRLELPWKNVERYFTTLTRTARQSTPIGSAPSLAQLKLAYRFHIKVVAYYTTVVQTCKERHGAAGMASYTSMATDSMDKAAALKSQLQREYIRQAEQQRAQAAEPTKPTSAAQVNSNLASSKADLSSTLGEAGVTESLAPLPATTPFPSTPHDRVQAHQPIDSSLTSGLATSTLEDTPWRALDLSQDSSISASSMPSATPPDSTPATMADAYARLLAQEGGESARDQYQSRMATPSQRQQVEHDKQSLLVSKDNPTLRTRSAPVTFAHPSTPVYTPQHSHLSYQPAPYDHHASHHQPATYTHPEGHHQPAPYGYNSSQYTSSFTHTPYPPAAAYPTAPRSEQAPTWQTYPHATPKPVVPFTPTVPARTPVRYEADGLKPLRMSSAVVEMFIEASSRNSVQGKETCGLLVGRLTAEALTMTAVIIPKQGGDKDSCQPTDQGENEVFEYQAEHDLLPLGWIHTHPTQTAFLSSVDLHTSFPYQLMLPEAIAIVCSIKYQDTRYFRLSERGLRDIAACREKGFHPHHNSDLLFCDASHVQRDALVETQLVDFR